MDFTAHLSLRLLAILFPAVVSAAPGSWIEAYQPVQSSVFSGQATDAWPVGDVNGDGLSDMLLGFGQTTYSFGGCRLVLGRQQLPSSDFLGTPDDYADVVIRGGQEGGNYLCSHSGGAGDIDQDGLDDILISAIGSSADNRKGAFYLLYGSEMLAPDIRLDLATPQIASFLQSPPDQPAIFGRYTTAAQPTVLQTLAGPAILGGYPAAQEVPGGLFLMRNLATIARTSTAKPYQVTLETDDTVLWLEDLNSNYLPAFHFATGGDFDGDGHPDLAVSVISHRDPQLHSPEIRVLLGPDLGLDASATVSSVFPAPDATAIDFSADLVGSRVRSLEFIGDIDGDGDDELAVGYGHRQINGGFLTVLSGGDHDASSADLQGGFTLYDERIGAGVGNYVASRTDFNADGQPDLVFAMDDPSIDEISEQIRSDMGTRILRGEFLLDATGALRSDTVSVRQLPPEVYRFFPAEHLSRYGDYLVQVVSNIGDINGDGLEDLVLVEPYADRYFDDGSRVIDHGSITVVFGRRDELIFAAPFES